MMLTSECKHGGRVFEQTERRCPQIYHTARLGREAAEDPSTAHLQVTARSSNHVS